MENKFPNPDVFKFVLVSILYSIGFIIFYYSKLSLDYIIFFQSRLIELFILDIQNISILEFLIVNFSPLFIFILGLIFFCWGLSFLSVKGIGNLKYFLILIFLPFGLLFNFSILFLFFCLGLYLVSIYVIPLGETYKNELKKWKQFRVGSNAVSKALFILFLLIFIGSFLALYFDSNYQQNFIDTTISSLGRVINAEIKNLQGDLQRKIIQNKIQEIREQYPNLTEEQYSEIGKQLRSSIETNITSAEELNMSKIVESKLRDSLIVKSLSIWFPFFISFTIWIALEFLRTILLAPLSGIFSLIFFKIGGKANKS